MGEPARECIVCNGFGSVDPTERVVDWGKPEKGFQRDEQNTQLAICPACHGAGKERAIHSDAPE